MTARKTFLASFLVACSLGTVLIASYWIHEDLKHRAVMNSVLFIAVMAVLHLAGYQFWQRQPPNPSIPTPNRSLNPRAVFGVILFGIFLFLSGIQFNRFMEMRQLAAERAAVGKPFAPTMISEPAGWAVTLLCFGLISLLAGSKKTAPTQPANDTAK